MSDEVLYAKANTYQLPTLKNQANIKGKLGVVKQECYKVFHRPQISSPILRSFSAGKNDCKKRSMRASNRSLQHSPVYIKDIRETIAAGRMPFPEKEIDWRRRSILKQARKRSFEDSPSTSLMTSFDISGKFDVDSTSCSLCSSDEMIPKSWESRNQPTSADATGRCKQASFEDDPTIASSSDSFTLASVPNVSAESFTNAVYHLAPPPSCFSPGRHFRQARSLKGLRPVARPSLSKSHLSSSLTELAPPWGLSPTEAQTGILKPLSAPLSPNPCRNTLEPSNSDTLT